jgi:outer membrane immunogenic protein
MGSVHRAAGATEGSIMRIHQFLMVAVSAAAVSTSAFAADLPTRKAPAAPPVYAPAFSWSGAYLGAFVGGNWAKASPAGAPALNSNDITAGGLAGYNWAFNSFVLGGEFEAGYDHKAVSAGYQAGGPFSVGDVGAAEGRIRGRVGYAWGPVLLFGAGGVTAEDLRTTFTNNTDGFSQEIGHWRTGWNIGGGLEWAFADHWTIRGEYIYDSFEGKTYDYAHLNPGGVNFGARGVGLTESTARAVLAYKF